jgi:hypothetical protein
MAIETRTTGMTVITVEALDPAEAAVIVVPSGETEVANPAELIVATPGTEEVHVALLVISCAVPSEKTPVAVNAWVFPKMIDGLSGLTAMELIVGGPVSVVGW